MRPGASGRHLFRQANRPHSPALRPAHRHSRLEDRAVRPLSLAGSRAHSRRELERLRAAGIEAVLLQNKSSITFSAYTYAQLGAEAFTLELGKARAFGQNELVNLDLLENALHALIEGREVISGEPTLDGLQLFAVSREVIKHSDSFQLHLPADIENFTELEPGYLLAEDIADSRWMVEEKGARIIFPNPKVKNGLRAAILIVPDDGAGLA
nr:succinylglutamate desuccinylase [Pseudomonas oleovorans]